VPHTGGTEHGLNRPPGGSGCGVRWPRLLYAIDRERASVPVGSVEDSYPENGCELAMNGAEVVYRASLPAPFTENDFFEIINRARALELLATSPLPFHRSDSRMLICLRCVPQLGIDATFVDFTRGRSPGNFAENPRGACSIFSRTGGSALAGCARAMVPPLR
jgi:hypothetical protein